VALQGGDVVLTSLRRRGEGWLEARIVNLAGAGRTALLRADIIEARGASLRGEPGNPLAVSDGSLRLELRPAEIRTIQLRRRESATRRPRMFDASAPRQSG
jgi:alpha-mannosidase